LDETKKSIPYEVTVEKVYCKKCGKLTRCGTREPNARPTTDGGYYWCSQCGEVTAKWSDKLQGPVDIETGEPVLHGTFKAKGHYEVLQ